ncbi:outer membrane protein [Celerinatantimonas sp. YJH-8]|uniref:outer membrane protein n=1 Tax=Celerinatantimonas sp. YJH-8 TaxID=3228714 RepID=UPI0038C6AA99
MQKVVIGGLLFLSASASAATMPTGLYGKVGFGQNFGFNKDTTINQSFGGTSEKFKDHLDFKRSNSYEIALGYRYPQLSWLTTEVALSYHSKMDMRGKTMVGSSETYDQPSQTSIKSTTLMFSGQIDLATYFDQDKWLLHPYVGLGVGVSHNKLEDSRVHYRTSFVRLNTNDSHTDFAWQAKLGVTYAATQHIVLDLSYAYNDYGKATSDKANYLGSTVKLSDIDYRTQEVMLGMRYFF